MVKKDYSKFLVIGIFTLLLVVVGFEIANKTENNFSLTGNVVLNPPIPATCDDQSIMNTWNSVFKEQAPQYTANETNYTRTSQTCSVGPQFGTPTAPCGRTQECIIPKTCWKKRNFDINWQEIAPYRYCNRDSDCSPITGYSVKCQNSANTQTYCHNVSVVLTNVTRLKILKDQDISGCPLYVAWFNKTSLEGNSGNSETYILIGKNDPAFTPQKQVIGMKGQFDKVFLRSTLLMNNLDSWENYYQTKGFNYTNKDFKEKTTNRVSRILTHVGADIEFENIFKPQAEYSEWTETNVCYGNLAWRILGRYWYCPATVGNQTYFRSSDTDESGKKVVEVSVAQDKNLSILTYGEYVTPPCVEVWTNTTSACQSNDKITLTFTETACGKPSRTETIDCDYNERGVIGQSSEVEREGIDSLSIKVDGATLSDSADYSSRTKAKIEIFDGSDKLVEFNWSFADESLNLRNVEVQKEGSSNDYGYLIVNGVEAKKTFRVSKKGTSNDLCIVNEEVSGPNEISSDCDNSGETFIHCPGTKSGYTCSIDDDVFVVTGLTHSGVEEMSELGSGGSCTPSWDCTAWSSCTSGTQTRTCTDSESCGTTSGKPATSQSCTITPGCTPNWDCTEWSNSEESCGERVCTDLKSCGTTSGKPDESKSCPIIEPPKTWIIWLIIGILVLLAIIVIVTIMVVLARSKKHHQMGPGVHPMHHNLPPR